MKRIALDLDEVEAAQLAAFCNVNNISMEEGARQLISAMLAERIDAAMDEVLEDRRKTRRN